MSAVASLLEVPGGRDDLSSLRGCREAPLTLALGCERSEREIPRLVVDLHSVLFRKLTHWLEHRPSRTGVLGERDLAAVRTPRASFDVHDVAAVHMESGRPIAIGVLDRMDRVGVKNEDIAFR